MAKKQISAIEAVTLSAATFSDETFRPTYINFFFGKNGAGKTTLGSQLGEGVGIQWAAGEIPANYEIELYNQDFIDRHFRTLDRLRGVFSLSEGKEAEEAEARIKALEERRKELLKRQAAIIGDNGERQSVASDLQKAESAFQAACLRNTKSLRDKFKLAFKGASRNPQLFQKINSTAPCDCDEAGLEKLYQTAFSGNAKLFPFMTELDGNDHIAAVPDCPLLGEAIQSRGTTEFARFVTDIGALGWIEEGHMKFHTTDGVCPYCQQKLPADFERLFASCFDDEYRRKVQSIEAFCEKYARHMAMLYEIIKKATEQDTLPSLSAQIEKLRLMAENFLISTRNMIAVIEAKLKDPSKIVKLEDYTSMLLDMNNIIVQCNREIQKNNDIVAVLSETQGKCIQSVWALAAFRLQGDVGAYRSAQGKAKADAKRLDDEAMAISQNLQEIEKEIEQLGTASITVQAAIDGMNKLLRDSGFEGFEIIKSDMAKDAYKVVRGDRKVAVRLSDGERHFLSFLYFYNRVKGCDPNGVQREKIVIIDDPVSSLDGNALFIISSLVREMIEVCYNNTDYRGQTVKGDYIRQLFILTHNAQFHRGITYNQVGRYSCVNFYKINKFNNQSSVKLCVRPSQTEAGEEENFNPVKNAYAALWSEYRELNSEIPLMNVIHRILDFYFLDMCGRDGMNIREEILVKERDKFVRLDADGKEDRTLFHLADSMLQYMGAGVEGDMNYVSDGCDVDQIRYTFEMIFRQLGQGPHFDMMMERAR